MDTMIEAPEIPGYKIEKILGQGGMATVYLGVQENLGREVAIKVMSRDMVQDKQYLQRFLNEAHTASRLAHPNIVTIHDVGQVEDDCFIVMERLHESLVERVKFKPDSRLGPGEAFKIIRQMASALDYAHKEGVTHRDIKPDNILFRKDGTPVLVDFGIARARDSEAHLTTTGMIIGTPHYMSPEQCRGEEIDGQSDLYGLGIVLYEILTGDVPYRADSAAGVLLKHVQYPIPRLPAPLSKYQTLLTRMMAKEKRERIHSGAELVRLLDSLTPDMRLDTIKGVKADDWVFAHSSPKGTPPPTTAPEEDSGIMTLHSPLQTPIHPPKQKSRGPVIVLLLTIPFILFAVYFIFFPNPWNQKETGKEPPPEPTKTADAQNTEAPVPDTSEAAAASGAVKDSTVPAEETVDEQHKRLLILAEEYVKEGDIDKALVKVGEARKLKDSPGAKALADRINQKIRGDKEKKYIEYYTLARAAYDNGNTAKAKEHIQKAREFGNTDELEQLARTIGAAEKKKADEAEKTRQAAVRKRKARQRDDAAYRLATSKNSLYAYEKYLKNYPRGRHAKEAQQKVDERKNALVFENKIEDDTSFQAAVQANTLDALETYLRKFPNGAHRQEADLKILRLKEKIVRETKVPLQLRSVRFFEAGKTAPAMSRRKYAAAFSAGSTRFIYTELVYDNKLYRVASSTSRVTLVYHAPGGVFTQELKGTVSQDRGARDGRYWRGMGWSQPGKWPPGNYTVTISLDGEQIGKGAFTIAPAAQGPS